MSNCLDHQNAIKKFLAGRAAATKMTAIAQVLGLPVEVIDASCDDLCRAGSLVRNGEFVSICIVAAPGRMPDAYLSMVNTERD